MIAYVICKKLSETKINVKGTSDNISNLRDGLDSFTTKIRSNEIIIKPADKGSIVVIMTPEFCWTPELCELYEYY